MKNLERKWRAPMANGFTNSSCGRRARRLVLSRPEESACVGGGRLSRLAQIRTGWELRLVGQAVPDVRPEMETMRTPRRGRAQPAHVARTTAESSHPSSVAEQCIRNAQVRGSTPRGGSTDSPRFLRKPGPFFGLALFGQHVRARQAPAITPARKAQGGQDVGIWQDLGKTPATSSSIVSR